MLGISERFMRCVDLHSNCVQRMSSVDPRLLRLLYHHFRLSVCGAASGKKDKKEKKARDGDRDDRPGTHRER